MKRRWFLAGLTLSAVSVGCKAATDGSAEGSESSGKALRNSKTLVVATSANYPPYEYLRGGSSRTERPERSRNQDLDSGSTERGSNGRGSTERGSTGRDLAEADLPEEGPDVVGFDIDIATLIAARLERKLELVDVEFSDIIPSLMNDNVDMAIAAIEPNRSRKQRVDFSNIYYRSRQALVSIDGYLRSRDLAYQSIGIRAGSVQARYANRISEDYPDLDIIPYDSLEEALEAVDEGIIAGLFIEANIADDYLRSYPDFESQIMPSDQPSGSAIAFPKNSPLRRDINSILSDLKSNGEMDQLIEKWFS